MRTTLDPKMQLMARKSLADGLVRYDEAHGWHGVVKTIDIGQDWGVALGAIPGIGRHQAVAPRRRARRDRHVDPHRPAARSGRSRAKLSPTRETGTVTVDGNAVDLPAAPRAWLKPGDVFYVEPVAGQDGQYRLRQIPEVSGACVAMDPFTGRVLAMVGGFSFDQSEFNRATQA